MSASSTPRAGGRLRDDHPGPAPAPGRATVRSAWLAAALLCVVAVFHAALVLGAPWGELTQGGRTSGTLSAAGRAVAAGSAALSLLMAGAILGRVGRGPLRRLPSGVRTVLAWFTTAYAALAVLLNTFTPSADERRLWAPTSVLLLGLVVYVMATSRSRLPDRRE
jgi:hypothetical protein